MKPVDTSRRDFVKKAAYVAPAVLSLTAVASVAKAGSTKTSTKPKVKKKKKKI